MVATSSTIDVGPYSTSDRRKIARMPFVVDLLERSWQLFDMIVSKPVSGGSSLHRRYRSIDHYTFAVVLVGRLCDRGVVSSGITS